MSPWSPLKKLRRSFQRRTQLPTHVQQLEVRALPAGVVTVTLSEAGDFTILGDSSNNLVEVFVDDGEIRVAGFDETSISFGGSTFEAGTEVNIPFEGSVINQFVAMLRDGNDGFFVTIADGVSVTVAGDVIIGMDSGDDDVEVLIGEGASVRIGNGINLRGASGNDTIEIFGAGLLRVNDDFVINTSTGSDEVLIDVGTLTVFGRFEVDTGLDDDEILVFLENAQLDDVRLQGSSGNNTIQFVTEGDGSVRVNGTLAVRSAEGNDTLVLGVASELNSLLDEAVFDDLSSEGGPDVTVGRDLDIVTGGGADVILVAGITANRDFLLISGPGNDLIAATDLEAGRDLILNTKSGHDRIFAINVSASRNLTVDTGAGDDQMVVQNLQFAEMTGRITVQFGSGNDKLGVLGGVAIGDEVISARFDGSAGMDDLFGPAQVAFSSFSFRRTFIDDDFTASADTIIEDILEILSA